MQTPILFSALVLAAALAPAACGEPPAEAGQARWYRGNTHTHTFWSDGDAAPEHVVDWYVENGYSFLVLSDHDIFQDHEKWFPISEEGNRPLRPEHVEALRKRFGPDWVETRETETGPEMRLKRFDELVAVFESDGFILIPGEEVSDAFYRTPVHINAMNVESAIKPQGGESIAEMIQRNIDAIIEHGHAHGRPVLAHVNHPNFGWALTAEDLAAIRGERFFEVYNGHRSVRNEGDADHPSTEELWDVANALRHEAGAEPLYALATDDAHNHHDPQGHSVPGRGWIMVRAEALDAGSIIEAMKRGDFYASSGVFLDAIETDDESLSITIRQEPGVTYETAFIGTRQNEDGTLGKVGETLATTKENPAVYQFRGEEIHVRARITSSRPHPRPYQEGDMETAWVQPVVPMAESQR